jgi:Na+-translocating ferredoxin:NAD+ oxidoreductase RnfD subunit
MSEREQGYNGFLPLLLGMLTLVIWFGFQTIQLLKERETLSNLKNNQTQIYGNAQKMRAQLDTLAAETAKLAAAGNANATLIVNALKQRGITIDPSKAAAGVAAPGVATPAAK